MSDVWGTVYQLERDGARGDDPDSLRREIKRLRGALELVAGFGSVNLAGEWEHGLRDIIRSMTDCARDALAPANITHAAPEIVKR